MEVLSGTSARMVMLRSLQPIARAIGSTLGPDGRPCLYHDDEGVKVLSTGTDVARFSASARGPLSIAPRLLKETLVAAERDLGDGTARLAIAFIAMLRHGTALIECGASPHSVADSLVEATSLFAKALEAVRCGTPDLPHVARSAGLSKDYAEQLAVAAGLVGRDGYLEIIEEGRCEPEIRTGEGFVFDAEPVSPALLPVPLAPVHVLVANEMIDDFGRLVPILEGFATKGKALLIVARDVFGPALQALVRNRIENGLSIAALKPKAVSDEAVETLRDIAIASGAQMICDTEGTTLEHLTPAMLGRASRFSITRERALLIEGGGSSGSRRERTLFLRQEASRRRFLSLDRERLLRRAGRLSGKWCEVHLDLWRGHENRSRASQAQRAMASLQSALDSGVVRGGPARLAKVLRPMDADPASDLSFGWHMMQAAVSDIGNWVEFNSRSGAFVWNKPYDICHGAFPKPDDLVQDPMGLTTEIFARAASAAAALLRADTCLSI